MRRTIKKQIWMNAKEADALRMKAQKACLTEAGLIRFLIQGYEPKEKPDDRFYKFIRELSAIGNSLHQLAAKANALGFIDAPELKKQIKKLNEFEVRIENRFLVPDKSDMKWQ